MKHNQFSLENNPLRADGACPNPAPDLDENGMALAPSPDEVARRAYFSYVNQGSLPGRDVQHWLDAEAELLAERQLTRVHGFHHRPA